MSIFRFKKFFIRDDDASMKLGTDAVLLGAWANISEARTILDIGTGTGIIALMVAQRTPAAVRIDAIEISEKDANQARANIHDSPWEEKISLIVQSIQKFDPGHRYDVILCNPPYFSNSLLPPVRERSVVRHDIELTSEDLIDAALRLLENSGSLCVILPTTEGNLFITKATSRGLFLQRITNFFTRNGKPQERSLMTFGFNESIVESDALTLYTTGDEWSEEYYQLTREFYLERRRS